MKLKHVVRAALVAALVSTLSGCWMFIPPGGGGGGGGGGGDRNQGFRGGGGGGGDRGKFPDHDLQDWKTIHVPDAAKRLVLSDNLNRDARRFLGLNTLYHLQSGGYTNSKGEKMDLATPLKAAVEGTKYYPADADFKAMATPSTDKHPTVITVTAEYTLEAASRLTQESKGEASVLALNFASAKNPGGGFLAGSSAQEESLARSSGLYPCLLEKKEMYATNRKANSDVYSHAMIYSPQVPIFRNDNGALLPRPYLLSILSSPAVNAGLVKQRIANPQEANVLVLKTMRERITRILAIAAVHGHDSLVLGAFGCGVFRNDPRAIAQIFHDLLVGRPSQPGPFKGVFKRVVFATGRSKDVNYDTFSAVFRSTSTAK